MRLFSLALLLFSLLLHAADKDENKTFFTPLYSFSNANINYLDWTNETENKTLNGDFAYIGLEGGAGWKWGEIYAFANIENPTKKYVNNGSDNLRTASFADLDIKIKNGFRLHIQDFYLQGKPYYVNDFVIGIAYKYQNNSGLWIRPFVGVHYTNDTYFDGNNGYMTGWTFNYTFRVLQESFSIFQWNEIEFGRTKSFYLSNDGTKIGDGASWGYNGALALMWNINTAFTAELQYRYARQKLGNIPYQSAMIYTLKYNF